MQVNTQRLKSVIIRFLFNSGTGMRALTEVNRVKMCEGWLITCEHESTSNQCTMRFSVYLPPQAEQVNVPGLYFLSGLTCTDENVMVKAGAQRYAAEHGIALIAPDTSPRGDAVPDDADAYDYGKGAYFLCQCHSGALGR